MLARGFQDKRIGSAGDQTVGVNHVPSRNQNINLVAMGQE